MTVGTIRRVVVVADRVRLVRIAAGVQLGTGGGGGGDPHLEVAENNVVLPDRDRLDFGAGITASDAGDRYVVTVTAAGIGAIPTTEKGAANGVATLNGSGIVPNTQLDTELSALAGTTSAADRVPYFTGAGTASTTVLTSFARNLVGQLDAAAARSILVAEGTEFKGVADGYASLDSGGHVPDAQIPSAIARLSDVTDAVDAAVLGILGTPAPPSDLDTLTELAAAIDNDPDFANTIRAEIISAAGGGVSQAYVDNAIADAIDDLVASTPGTMDTLDEIAAALGDDPNFAATMTTQLAGKVDKSTFDANTLIKADTDNTPVALTVAEQTFVGRITGGSIAALTVAQARTLLGLGGAALLNVGTTAGTVMAGDDSRVTAATSTLATNVWRFDQSNTFSALQQLTGPASSNNAYAFMYPGDTANRVRIDLQNKRVMVGDGTTAFGEETYGTGLADRYVQSVGTVTRTAHESLLGFGTWYLNSQHLILNYSNANVGSGYDFETKVGEMDGWAPGIANFPRGQHEHEGITQYGANAGTGSFSIAWQSLHTTMNTPGVSANIAGGAGFVSNPYYVAHGATVAFAGNGYTRGGGPIPGGDYMHIGFWDNPVAGTIDSGNLTHVAFVNYYAGGSITGDSQGQYRYGAYIDDIGTLANYDPEGTFASLITEWGSLERNIGVYIKTLTSATLNLPIHYGEDGYTGGSLTGEFNLDYFNALAQLDEVGRWTSRYSRVVSSATEALSFVGATFSGLHHGGARKAYTAVPDGDAITAFLGGGYDGTDWAEGAAAVIIRATENWTNTANGAAMAFYVTPETTTTTTMVLDLDYDSAFTVVTAKGSLGVERAAADAFGSFLSMRKARGSLASPTATGSGDVLGYLTWDGYGTSAWSTAGSAVILAKTTQVWTNANHGTKLEVWTTPNNSTTSVLALTIDQDKTATFAGAVVVPSPTASTHAAQGRVGTEIQAYDADLAAIAALTPTDNDILQRKAGAWTNRTMAQLLADLDADLVALAAPGSLAALTGANLATDDGIVVYDLDVTSYKQMTPAEAGRGLGRLGGYYRWANDNGANAWSNDATERSVMAAAPTVTANTTFSTDSFRVKGALTWLNNSGAGRTLTLKCTWGTTVMATLTTPSTTASATAHGVDYEYEFKYIGSNFWTVVAKVRVLAASSPTMSNIVLADSYESAHVIAGQAPSSNRVIDVTATMSTNTATQTVTPLGTWIDKVNGAH